MDLVEHLKWVREKRKNAFEEKTDVHFSLLKDGTVGIIFIVVSMKQ
jgi:hypothetical protein